MNFAINKWDNMNYSHINMDKSSTRLLRPWDFPGKSGVPVPSPKEYIEWYYLNKTKKQRRQNNILFKEISTQVVKIIKNAKKKKNLAQNSEQYWVGQKDVTEKPKRAFWPKPNSYLWGNKGKDKVSEGPQRLQRYRKCSSFLNLAHRYI